MSKKLVAVCLINFLVASVMGLALRYSFIRPIDFNYRFLTHAHSHVAMLGWVYLMIYTFLVYYFVPEQKLVYTKLFWITQIAVVGMLLSFPFQGYASISISFSTLHIFCSYYFAYRLWKDLNIENTLVKNLVKTALIFMLISTIGVWCLGPAVMFLGKASAFYQIAIQFFLHFQFNGWFLIAVLALLFHQFQIVPSKHSTRFSRYLIVATVLTCALPVQWFANHPLLYWINGLGIILQLLSLYYFLKIIRTTFQRVLSYQFSLIKLMYRFALFCFVLKIVLQTVSIVPELSSNVYKYHNFVIGFIHLTMLGAITGFLFAFLLQSKTIRPTKIVTFGIHSFLLGFLLTESILLFQGSLFYLGQGMISNYYTILFLASILLPLGIACILFNYLKQKHNDHKTI